MKNLILITCLLQTVLAAPQLISFKDGKVGVNIFGYHAEAGLGGGPNGGGLHASAGTPWGQNAAAGLGGTINGRTAGGLYAGAQATPNVGAGAVLGGDTSQGGYSGSEAYANGKVSSHTRTIVAGNTQKAHETAYYPQYPTETAIQNVNAIQKIRPPKKYYSSETQHQTRRQLIAPPPPPPPHELMALPCDSHKQQCKNVNKEVRSDVVQSALQIPIGILQSLQQSLGGLGSH